MIIKELIAKQKHVYDLLEDKQSKDIFMGLFNYMITSEYSYIEDFVRKYVVGYNEMVATIKQKLKELESKKVVVYGVGFSGVNIYSALRDSLHCFCDTYSKKEVIAMPFGDIPVIKPDKLIANKNEYVVLVGTLFYYDEVCDYLRSNQVDMVDINAPELFDNLAELNSQYFDKELIQYADGEVFIDAGCNDFRTSELFLRKCGTVKKILAFEPDAEMYQVCVENSKHIKFATIHPMGLWCENTSLSFSRIGMDGYGSRINSSAIKDDNDTFTVEVCKLDDILAGSEATFIKMDIEGSELNALKGAKETINEFRPKLAISIYHKSDDIFEIPLYIHSIRADYKFYIRHYSGGRTETVLYAI